VLKIILVVLGVLVFLSLLAAGSFIYVVHYAKQKVRQFQAQTHITLPTSSRTPAPAGTLEVRTGPGAPTPAPSQEAATVIDTGVPTYPGATPVAGGAEVSGAEMGGVKVQQYVTSDSVDKVVSFYKDKLGSQATVMQSGNSAVVKAAGSNGVVTVTITVDKDSGKTKIGITSFQK
jgi:hypothetical protein